MPGIGKPQGIDGPNPFKGVTKYQDPNKLSKNGLTRGEILNRASGKAEMGSDGGIKYVDGNQHGKLDKDGFLKLLTFQLQNQDPSKPMDQEKIAAEMAQYSQLEQLTNMNATLTKSFEKAPMQAKFYAASFLGKKVVTTGSTVKYDGPGSNPRINFKLPKDVQKGMIRITDQKNQLIGQIDFSARTEGLHSLPWYGKQLDGNTAAKGVYRFEVLAYDELGNKVPAETQAEGVVQSVKFENGETVLTVDGKKVFLRDVQSFHVAADNEMSHNKNTGMDNIQAQLKNAQKKYQQNSEAAY